MTSRRAWSPFPGRRRSSRIDEGPSDRYVYVPLTVGVVLSELRKGVADKAPHGAWSAFFLAVFLDPGMMLSDIVPWTYQLFWKLNSWDAKNCQGSTRRSKDTCPWEWTSLTMIRTETLTCGSGDWSSLSQSRNCRI